MNPGRPLIAVLLLPLAGALHAEDVVLDAAPTVIPVDVEMALDVPIFGSSSSSAATTAQISGSQFLVERTGDSITFKDHLVLAENAQLNLEFFCGFFGCLESIDVTIGTLIIQLEGTYTVQLQGDQWSIPGALYTLDISYAYQGNLVGSGESRTIASDNADLTGTFTESGSSLSITNLDLSEVLVSVLPESLPTGVNSIDIRVDADLSDLVHEGATSGPVLDLDQDGRICGADLTILLSSWGGPGPADFDGDGEVAGPDLTLLLSAWSC
ncbi:MAG: hypothetical protein VXY94_10405 [Planctomycetota bacterium]|nr:hypothetical protein [Planctomycetota bacterium]MEC8735153.1 hypothetical protein [Planctomycetota bacterium]MEC9158733.1 hypothetical protein [Planctomycetota bacterium]MEC9233853.1 hypothetical protein [Planctomycetota bacterium]MED5507366.1 hypothetical protein [Planctomycetota bacterium]